MERKFNNKTSLLDEFRNERKPEQDQYIKLRTGAPAVSRQMIAHLETMFSPENIHASDPAMGNKLKVQLGIDKMLNYLRDLNAKQEDDVRRNRDLPTTGTPNREAPA